MSSTKSDRKLTITTNDENELVMLETEITGPGVLINTEQFTATQHKQVNSIVDKFDINNTDLILRYAEGPQIKVSAFLDSLIGDISTKDAGIAGQLAQEMSHGIDLLKLDKVKDQLNNPPATHVFARIWQLISGYKNYLKSYYLSVQPVTKLIDEIEKKARNRMNTLKSKHRKLDGLVVQTVSQIEELRIWLAAAEKILLSEIQKFEAQREIALQSDDPLVLSQLREHGRRIAQFETRVMKLKIAYVRAGNVSIPRARSFQEALIIETQNIMNGILFGLPQMKEAILIISTLKELTDAQGDRELAEENLRKLDSIINDVGSQVITKAKESQGSSLEQVERLQVTIDSIVTAIDKNVELEEESRSKRAEAAEKLVELNTLVGDSLKNANIDSAEAIAG